jgi:hypothetical protein
MPSASVRSDVFFLCQSTDTAEPSSGAQEFKGELKARIWTKYVNITSQRKYDFCRVLLATIGCGIGLMIDSSLIRIHNVAWTAYASYP